MKAQTCLLAIACLSTVAFSQNRSEEIKMKVKRITPVLYVKDIEPCVDFWTSRFGFQKTVEVPDGDRLGFVILQKDDLEIMYQSFASAAKDAPATAKDIEGGRTFLYIEVDKLDPFIAAAKNANIVVPVRTTFYGAKEIGLKEPAGHVVVFAEMAAPQK